MMNVDARPAHLMQYCMTNHGECVEAISAQYMCPQLSLTTNVKTDRALRLDLCNTHGGAACLPG